MSAELSIVIGIVEMFSGRDIKPWHGLGQIVKGLLTSREAIEAAHLDWLVEKRQLWLPINGKPNQDGDMTLSDNNSGSTSSWRRSSKFALTRCDTEQELGIVGKRYEVFQNSEAFEFFDAIVGEGRAVYDTAGALFGGKRIWISAKLNPDDFAKRKDDKFDHYALLTNTFDGGHVITMRQCSTRVVCCNTLTAALSEKQSVFRIRHVGDIQAKVNMAREAVGIMTESMRELEKVLDEIRGLKMNEREVKTFSYKVTPDSEPEQAAIRYLFTNGIGCEGKTRYDAFNAVTQLTTHHLGARGTDEMKAQRRLDSVIAGRGHAMQKRALGLLMPL